MRSGKQYFLHLIILTVALAGFTGTGCRKQNGIVNNNVVETPYSLYFSDKLGSLYNTNDGKGYKIKFPDDNFAARALTISGNNVLWVKTNVHVSEDEGKKFNPKNFSINTAAAWSSLILDVPSHDLVYLASTRVPGIEISMDHGLTWAVDGAVNPSITMTTVQSFAQLRNGLLFSLDNTQPLVYFRTATGIQWNSFAPATIFPAGAYYLSHFNNTLLAADYRGGGGLWYNNDTGKTWTQYSGIPTSQEIKSVSAPFDQVLLVGTDSAGVFRLVGNTFQPSNNGLEPFTTVYGIVGKQDFYKNDVIKQYVYIATSKGLYRSEDLGQNWVLMHPGDIRVIY